MEWPIKEDEACEEAAAFEAAEWGMDVTLADAEWCTIDDADDFPLEDAEWCIMAVDFALEADAEWLMESALAPAEAEAVDFDEALDPVLVCALPALVPLPVDALKHFYVPNPTKDVNTTPTHRAATSTSTSTSTHLEQLKVLTEERHLRALIKQPKERSLRARVDVEPGAQVHAALRARARGLARLGRRARARLRRARDV